MRASSDTRLWRLFPLVTLVALGALLPSAAAAPPLRDRSPVQAEFPWPPLTDACGFPVTLAFDGTFDIKVFSGPKGGAREIDTQPGTKLTYSSATGELTVPFSATLHTSYPQGIFAGAPATATLTGGSFGLPPLIGPGRGRLELSGTVEEVDDGVPAVRFTDLVSSSGDFASETARICAALGGA
jgi:hypothetical protein